MHKNKKKKQNVTDKLAAFEFEACKSIITQPPFAYNQNAFQSLIRQPFMGIQTYMFMHAHTYTHLQQMENI